MKTSKQLFWACGRHFEFKVQALAAGKRYLQVGYTDNCNSLSAAGSSFRSKNLDLSFTTSPWRSFLLDLEHHRTIRLCPYFDVTVHRKQHTKCSDTVSGHGTVQIRRCCDVFQGFFVQACQRSILILARGTGWHWWLIPIRDCWWHVNEHDPQPNRQYE